jgi:hypothetical protein
MAFASSSTLMHPTATAAVRGRALSSRGKAATPLTAAHSAKVRSPRRSAVVPATRAMAYSDGMPNARIKVVGCGGGGGNAVNRMINSGLEGVEFWSLNTDAQALVQSQADNRLQIGKQVTRGLGTVGRRTLTPVPQLKGAWFRQPLNPARETPVSKFALQMQLAALRRGRQPRAGREGGRGEQGHHHGGGEGRGPGERPHKL